MQVNVRGETTRASSPRGSGRFDDPDRRSIARIAAVLSAVAALLAAVALALPSPAQADESAASPALVPAAAAADDTFRVTSHRDDEFVSGSRAELQGSGTPGATVQVTGNGIASCTTTVGSDGRWDCAIDLPNGRTQLTLTSTPAADASASPSPSPSGGPSASPSPVPTTISLTLRALSAPSITGAGTIYSTGIITGTGYPRAGVSVTTTPEGGGAAVTATCPAVAVDGSWSCPISTGPGRYSVTARQFSPDAPGEISPASAARTLVIDQDAPAAPVIDSPADGSRISGATTFTGRGETDASVDVFAEGDLLCSAQVSAGAWSCVAQITGSGRHVVQAMQRDVAGNYSAPSAVLRLIFGGTSTSPSPSPSPSSPTSPTPGAPSDPSSPTPPGTTPPSTPDGSGGSGSAPQGDGGLGGGWADPTRFGSALPTLTSALGGGGWLSGLLLAAAFVLLVALPLRLLVAAAGPRLRVQLPKLFGRNQRGGGRAFGSLASGTPSSDEDDDASPAWRRWRPWVVLGALLLAATLITALAIGVQDQQRYARMLVAIAIGVTAVNGVGVVVASALVARAAGVRRVLRLVPVFLLVGMLGALVSRWLGLEPPLVVGVVLAVAAVGAVGDRAGALIHLAQIGSIAALAVVAWVVHDATGGAGGMLGSGLSEVLTAITVSGLGSAVLLLVPVGSLPGRAIFDWSPLVWVGVALVAVLLAALALASGSGFPMLGTMLAAFVVGAVCLGGWAWIRWVEPALAAR
ncbi:hypothetical protein [Schumannella sp. 10F1B-5-1]|uniref:hypothetical protein n=1 Tax=Schumannella sp. 10F1B-5-1 TaxID=2590780 RepID=UPI0015E875E6|nr:hypothetical protein [Schumannella sp. 10F1B-5-1]